MPDGVKPGQSLVVSAPDGRRMSIVVPEGMVPGSVLEVRTCARVRPSLRRCHSFAAGSSNEDCDAAIAWSRQEFVVTVVAVVVREGGEEPEEREEEYNDDDNDDALLPCF